MDSKYVNDGRVVTIRRRGAGACDKIKNHIYKFFIV